MLNKSENELSGVFSTAMACLGLYRDPVIAENTSSSDFRIADLMNADRPVSLYLVVPPSDLARTRPIIRLILNQIGRRLTESMHFGTKTAYRIGCSSSSMSSPRSAGSISSSPRWRLSPATA